MEYSCQKDSLKDPAWSEHVRVTDKGPITARFWLANDMATQITTRSGAKRKVSVVTYVGLDTNSAHAQL